METYVKRRNVYPTFKAICHKSYEDLQLLLVLTNCLKNLSIDFITDLPLSTNQKSDSYNLIFIIINSLTKMIHNKPVKVTINILKLAEVIIDMMVQYHGFFNSIISDCKRIFSFKFWSSLYSFVDIKNRLSTAFYP